MSVTFRIGTSGWHYPHWRGTFYPADLSKTRWLSYYAERFDTVEINNSFYRLPSVETTAAWGAETPRHFRFAIKANRFMTHMKKLSDPDLGFERLEPVLAALGARRGPVLFQLPPKWKPNLARLETFLCSLPKGRRYAFEFRQPDWHCDPVYRLLRRYRAAFCIYDIGGVRSPLQVTTDFAYLRLHGPGAPYQGRYSAGAMDFWARQFRAWEGVRKIFVYFDNDQAGYAAINALELRQKLGL